MSAKYSIIVPCRNGMPYLSDAIQSILSQSFSNYELIISDDHSTDGTKDWLTTIKADTNVKYIEPGIELSMVEHWEWALNHASGDWLIFLGQDDGVQPYFFRLAEELTSEAVKKSLRIIMSRRAYFFWPGCEGSYGDVSVNYQLQPSVKVLNSFLNTLKALFGFSQYFDLPQMYTTSLFHRSVIDEVKIKQDGKVFSTQPQDANLAALAVSMEKKYLYSGIPLGWVGSSPKSAGLAVSLFENQTPINAAIQNSLRNEYLEKVNNSVLRPDIRVGSFEINSTVLYWYGALLKTASLRSNALNAILSSRACCYIVVASAQANFFLSKYQVNDIQKSRFCELIERSNLSLVILSPLAYLMILLQFLYQISAGIRKLLEVKVFKVRHLIYLKNKSLSLSDANAIIRDDNVVKKGLDRICAVR